MTIQTLVSAVKVNPTTLADRMQLETDAIIINQCPFNGYEQYEYQGHMISCYSFLEQGVGLSRNSALVRAQADIILFSDDDIVYEKGYAKKILDSFRDHPDADMLLFNMDVSKERMTYHTQEEKRIHWFNCGRYPTYSFALRLDKARKENLSFSLLFGGGAKYSNGEDSIFIHDCLKSGFKIYALPVTIGKEVSRPSTWFHGYNEKFFFDRGVLYKCLYGNMAQIFARRFLIKNKGTMLSEEIPYSKAYSLMKKGMREWSS